MNILLHIHGLSGGGAERSACVLAEALVAYGHRVDIVTCETASKTDYPLANSVRRLVIDVSDGTSRMGRMLKRLLQLRSLIKQSNADIVLGFMTTSSLYSVVACLGLGAKCVCCERVAPQRQPLSRIGKACRKLVYRWSTTVVCQTKDAALWFRRALPASRVEVIPNAVKLPLPDGDPHLIPSDVIQDDALVILAVGRLEYQKGFDLLLAAFSNIRHQMPEAHLVVLGEGSERLALESAIDAGNLRKHVSLPGRAGNMMQWYERATFFVLSSRFEGFPNVLLEAMAAGLPVLATDCHSGPAEILGHESSGLLVPNENVDAISEGLAQLVNDPALRDRLGKGAQAGMSRYAVGPIARQWHDLLTELNA